MASIFLKNVFLFIRLIQAKGIFQAISKCAFKPVNRSILTKLIKLQLFILLKSSLAEVNFQSDLGVPNYDLAKMCSFVKCF